VADESISWPTPPDFTDVTDGAQNYNLGRDFTLTAARPIVGVEWRVPDSLAAPGGGPHAVAIWDEATGTRLAYRTIDPTPGGLQRFLFSPSDYLAGETLVGETEVGYTASVYTNHYTYRPGAAVGSTSPSGDIVAGNSQLIPHNTGAANAPMPDVLSTANFYISPVVSLGDVPEEHTTAGVAAATATATATAATTRPAAGAARALGSATATTATARATAGPAPASATAAASVATVRGVAAVGRALLAATGSTATARATAGVARAIAAGGSYQAAGAPGPWLTSRGHPSPIVKRSTRA
jgi:hypothetical protein